MPGTHFHDNDFYDKNASTLCEHYDAINPDQVHAAWLPSIPEKAGLACDIGAGSGRDANWLAAKGWDVIAVEPSKAMRDQAAATSHPNVTWLDDSLPDLARLRTLGHRFDLVLISAVWMHIPATQRERAFRLLSELLGPGGVLVITLRHGADEAENQARGFFSVSSEELLAYARARAVAVVSQSRIADSQRAHVQWETLVFRLPDDGTGSLPLLRHIIVNDNKSSSYKLGLLRVLTRIAESAPGIVLRRTDEAVDIPFGIVGLYWIKLYMPLLLTHKIPQHPNRSQGYGFAGDDFHALAKLSNYDLRVGASFDDGVSATVTGAIRKACDNIQKMPAHYITYPGQNRSIFACERLPVRKVRQRITLSKDYLASFGVFRIPAKLWQTLGQYACWLDPTIVREWSGLTQSWGISDYRAVDASVFEWEEGRRDTSVVSRIVTDLQAVKTDVRCIWSAGKIKQPHIDHCFPWSRWYNNDLWNLFPTRAEVNISKGDKLPSAAAMHDAKQRILNWWEVAYTGSALQDRFLMEVESSLPRLKDAPLTPEDVYAAVLHQRARLKADQQLVEWSFR